MRRSGTGSGGGFGSRNVRHTSNPKSEPKPYARNPGAVAQYGELVGSHVRNKSSTRYRGEPDFTRKGYSPPQGPTSFSNVGPAGGRTVMKSGQQSCHGTPDRGMPGLPSTRGEWPDRR
jgi:hypothetical protein